MVNLPSVSFHSSSETSPSPLINKIGPIPDLKPSRISTLSPDTVLTQDPKNNELACKHVVLIARVIKIIKHFLNFKSLRFPESESN